MSFPVQEFVILKTICRRKATKTQPVTSPSVNMPASNPSKSKRGKQQKHKKQLDFPQAACRVKQNGSTEYTWILGYILQEVANRRYEIQDVEPDEKGMNVTHWCPRRFVIKIDVDPPRPIYTPGTAVIALYPETTVFYPAVVVKSPTEAEVLKGNAQYTLMFDGDEEGLVHQVDVPLAIELPKAK